MGGRVTYTDTGEPVEFGTVSFSSQTKQSRGEIKEDGKYVIGTFGDKDGLPPGEYNVTVHAVKTETTVNTGTDKSGREGKLPNSVRINLLDTKYLNPATSGLKVVVDGKTKTFDISVDRAPKKKLPNR
ncbi:hypothetical protein FACS189443_6850 [Planctomycetales bacterium]|nr:hypothetical protein FACS189443_6850 [Planctomycetales bacterium]